MSEFKDAPSVGLKSLGKKDFNNAVSAVKSFTSAQNEIGALDKKLAEEQAKLTEAGEATEDSNKLVAKRTKLAEGLANLRNEAKSALSVLSAKAAAAVPGSEGLL